MFPRALKVTAIYKNNIPKITKVKSEEIIISEGSNFIYHLQNIFIAHPKIQQTYPPGKLALRINKNQMPAENYYLRDGDTIEIYDV